MSVPRRSLTRREWPTGEPVFSLEVQPEHVRDELLVLRLEDPRFRSLLHPCFPGRDDGDLGHGEKTVHEDQEQKKQEFHGNRLEGRSWDELYPASDPIPLGPEEHPRGRNGADRIKTESVEKTRSPEFCWLPGQDSNLQPSG